MSSPSPEQAREVLDFWFGPNDEVRAEWFRKDAAFDAEIERRFGSLIVQAIAGGLDAWQAAPDPALARIVVLDQFTRNTRRNRADAFEGDALALAGARAMVAAAFDLAVSAVRRPFVYMPFMHAEGLEAQDECVRLFTELARLSSGAESNLDYAHRHRVIIERFGRFPHRNAALGRPSTPEETEFLKQPGSGF
ncbi:DUF924 family protein [Piscinibacter terrae]|uniref:DUF924 domain-containing protein n=1 Tax=Piscinibacter terrae TaxID=2496871 RepID=A0A3N7HU42_9BURK|nr:DUF924 family protein [Albitalea terrae]RQP24816.1 DUF924 domain-containing protein [Albitalea terrae]